MIVKVPLGERSYDITIDEDKCFPSVLSEMYPDNDFVLITNDTINEIYSEKLSEWEKKLNFKRCILKDGEQYKSIESWNQILTFMLENRYDRKVVMIAFGGGVIGDITGFAASAYLRGVDFVQVPTTLLAMVDSSVGGKTAVNHPMGKNMIGAFYQPKLVHIETSMLDTLKDREFYAGYAEVVKYGFLGGRDMFDFIKENHTSIMKREKDLVREAIRRSVQIKSDVVAEDEKESGKRALLNFGHTFGHALERYYSYKGILHGEGIVWGIKCAVKLGKVVGTVSENDASFFNDLVNLLELPALPDKPDVNKLYDAMFSDKKVVAGDIRFVVPTIPGESIVQGGISKDDVFKVLRSVFE